jgi:hypothetical protein
MSPATRAMTAILPRLRQAGEQPAPWWFIPVLSEREWAGRIGSPDRAGRLWHLNTSIFQFFAVDVHTLNALLAAAFTL